MLRPMFENYYKRIISCEKSDAVDCLNLLMLYNLQQAENS